MSRNLAAFLLLSCALGAPSFVHADTFNVNLFDQDLIDNNLMDCICNTDAGGCTLRAAVMQANACPGTHTIHFANSALDQTIELTLAGSGGAEVGDLNITKSLNIRGWWSGTFFPPEDADRLPIIDASALGSRIFRIEGAGVQVDIRGLQLRGGTAGEGSTSGGAILNNADLTVHTVRFEDNEAASGGAIANSASGTLTVLNSDFILNLASDGTRGGAAIANFNSATIRRSSFRDNRHSGSPREVIYSHPGSSLFFEDSTLSGAPEAPGSSSTSGIRAVNPALLQVRNSSLIDIAGGYYPVWLTGLDGSGTIRIANSILSNNAGSFACVLQTAAGDAGNVLIDHSLIRSADPTGCNDHYGPNVVDGTAPLLSPFTQNLRQLTRYRPLPLGSSLRDAGNPDSLDPDAAMRCTTTAQNGVSRPQDGDADGVARCDIGATEAANATPITFIVDTSTDAPDANPGDGICATAAGDCSLRAAVMEANVNPGADRIEFAESITQATLSLNGPGGASGELQITQQLTIAGNLVNGYPATTVRGGAAFNHRLFSVNLPPGETARIEGLTLSHGRAPALQAGGALMLNSDNTVTLESVVLRQNQSGAFARGGALAAFAGELVLRDADLFENSADLQQGWSVYIGPNARLVMEDSSVREHGSDLTNLADLKSAIFLDGGEALIVNSTFFHNELGLYAVDGFDLSLRNSSFAIGEGTSAIDPIAPHHLRLNGNANASLQLVATAFEEFGNCLFSMAPGSTVLTNHYNLSDGTCAIALGLGGGNVVQPAALHWGSAQVEGRVARVMLPRLGSPLLDRVPVDAFHCPAQDQRGAPRPVSATGQAQALCDIGAVELSSTEAQPKPWIVNVFDVDLADVSPCDGRCDADESIPGEQCTLRAAAMESNCPWQQDHPMEIHIPEAGVTLPLTLAGANVAFNGDTAALTFNRGNYARRILGPDVEGDVRPLIQASHGDRIFLVLHQSLEIANVRISGGESASLGGAIFHHASHPFNTVLHLRNVELFDNTAQEGGAIVANDETLLERVSVHGNSAEIDASAIFVYLGSLTLVDSSVHNNTVLSSGNRSAIAVNFNDTANMVISNTTISGNNGIGLILENAEYQDGAYVIESSSIVNNAGYAIGFRGFMQPASVGTLVVRHSALHGNALGGCRPTNELGDGWNGVFDTIGYNLSQDGACGMAGGTNLIGVPALLGPLQSPTHLATAFHLPLPGSPLIDGGSPDAAACPDTDQLGTPRPQDGDGDGVARCNIGALETATVHPPPPPPPPPPGDAIFSNSFEG